MAKKPGLAVIMTSLTGYVTLTGGFSRVRRSLATRPAYFSQNPLIFSRETELQNPCVITPELLSKMPVA